ncbi:MAG: hypothetical protein EOP83_25395, partial [Verrucomicrobiaceae bacterium]
MANRHDHPVEMFVKNPFRMPKTPEQKSFDFAKGEYVLPRKVRRWLERRLIEVENVKVRLAAVSLATMIGRYHTGPRVAGRDFFLCRKSLPAKFQDEHGTIHSEWHLRLARAELVRIGFIERVTPVGRLREIAGGRWGRWLKAKRVDGAIRTPPVMFRFVAAIRSLFSEALQTPDRPKAVSSPLWGLELFRTTESLTREVGSKHGGEEVSETRKALEQREAENALKALERRAREGLRFT